MRWYVVAFPRSDIGPGDPVWTISRTPGQTGWETDCGYPGYGLTFDEASELANAANAAAAARDEAARTEGLCLTAGFQGRSMLMVVLPMVGVAGSGGHDDS